jgi:hypothetical protein
MFKKPIHIGNETPTLMEEHTRRLRELRRPVKEEIRSAEKIL